MDSTKLKQLWQRYITSPPSEPEEVNTCLTRLLDITLNYFSTQDNSHYSRNVADFVQDEVVYRTTRTCIGNWLIHQFIIGLSSSAKPLNTSSLSEFQVLNEYFVNGIGWKLVKCIQYFNADDALLCNIEFIEVLMLILKSYLTSLSGSNNHLVDVNLKEINASQIYANSDFSFFKPKFNEKVYLKTLKSDVLSPPKVKLWIKCSRNLASSKTNNKKSHLNKCALDSDEEDFVIPRRMMKFTINKSKLFFKSKTINERPSQHQHVDLSSELELLCREQPIVPKPTEFDIVATIEEILLSLILLEHKNTSKMSSYVRDFHTPNWSFLITEQMSNLFADILEAYVHQNEMAIVLLKPLKNLLIALCMTVCRDGAGVKLVDRLSLTDNLFKLLVKLNFNIKQCKKDLNKSEHMKQYLRNEFLDTFCTAIHLLIQISKYLLSSKEFTSFQNIMDGFFQPNIEELLVSLVEICEITQECASRPYNEFMYRFVDLLQQLQVTLQYSQGLYIHKLICKKNRHNKCDLAPLMVHHLYHQNILRNEKKPKTIKEIPSWNSCVSCTVYHTLIKLILICSKRNSDSVDKLICYIINHLGNLITCCWSLKRYFKQLLYFAVNSNRSNVIQSTIFNIIEFSIKIQRKHLYTSVFYVQKCSYCSDDEVCESGFSTDIVSDDNKDSTNSEGYLTDNGNSSFEKSKTAFKTDFDHCSDSNCLIKALSIHYTNMLKSENVATRQTVFRHFFNLFSYLSSTSKTSILSHIIFPVFQNYNAFSFDVCSFILRLFIVLSEPSNQKNSGMNFLNIFVKANGFILLKQVILCIVPATTSCNEKQLKFDGDGYCNDLSVLGICLLENLIKLELMFFKSNQCNLVYNNSGACTEISPSSDLSTLTTVSCLIELFREHFSLCTRSSVIHLYENSLINKPQTLDEYIEFFKKVTFNVNEIENAKLTKLFHNLLSLLKLLTTSNNILKDFDFFRLILIHDSVPFSEKVFQIFQQLFHLILNEINLFQLLIYRNFQCQQSTNNAKFVEIDLARYDSFFSKILKILKQLLTLLLQMVPFYFDKRLYTSKDISMFIQTKLMSMIDNSNLLIWRVNICVDPVLDLLKMLIGVTFNSSQDLKCHTKYSMDDLLFALDAFSSHPRTSSFDSMMSDNETNNDTNTADLDSYNCGYEADTECYISDPTPKKSNLSSYQNLTKSDPHSKCMPYLKYVDLCKVIVYFLSQYFFKRNQLNLEQIGSNSQCKSDHGYVLSIINSLTQMCKENHENSKILFDHDFTSFIMKHFESLFYLPNSNYKVVKIAIFDLFIEIAKVELRPSELKLIIDLFKYQNIDHEFLISILHKLMFSEHWDIVRPRYSVTFPLPNCLYPTEPESKKHRDWIESIIFNTKDELKEDELSSVKSMACVLPINSVKMSSRNFSIAFWIYFDKIQPLIDKFKTCPDYSGDLKNSKNTSDKLRSNSKLIHILSMVFHSSTIEFWFDYVYNLFVYRLCKENHGKWFYFSENFVKSQPNFLGKWNFLRINIGDVFHSESKSHFLKISHSINCTADKVTKLTYPSNFFNKSLDKIALLIGSSQAIQKFHYRLGNVFLFRDHLQTTSTIYLYSLGADFSHLHHLKSKALSENGYFIFPKQLFKESDVDVLSAMLQNSPVMESKLICENIVLLYKASHPNIYFTYGAKELPSTSFANIFPKLNLLQTGTREMKGKNTANCAKISKVKLFCDVKCDSYYGLSKTVADSGGISVFIFMFFYLLDQCDNQKVLHKALELVIRVYDSHYYHRFVFDNHYTGYRLLLYVLEKSRKSFQPSVLFAFSKLSIMEPIGGYPLVYSLNVEVYLNSWKVWARNLDSMESFFSLLHSLIDQSNPYRYFNISQLGKANAFDKLLKMIKDLYINFFDDINHLNIESLNKAVTVFNAIIDTSDLELLKSIIKCVLLLQKSEHLNISQTKSSFYYVFPSTWITKNDNADNNSNGSSEEVQSSSPTKHKYNFKNEDEECGSSLSLEDWDIVSESIENQVNSPKIKDSMEKNSFVSPVSAKSNWDYVLCELLMIIDQFLDHVPDISTLEPLIEDMTCLDFLLVFINNPSDRVRRISLSAFFKLYKLYYDSDNSKAKSNENDQTKGVRSKTVSLLLVCNQLYNHMANEDMVNVCLAFILNVNHKNTVNFFNQDNNESLKESLSRASIENFMPFFALLPKCIHSIGFCHKVLQMFHRLISSLPIKQVSELQRNYGLVQSLSKLIINLNTQAEMTKDDINKYSKEYVNEEICRTLFEISHHYVLSKDCQNFDDFVNLVHYFSLMERKVTNEVGQVFRQVQISVLQAAFNAYTKIKNYYNETMSKQNSLEVIDLLKFIVKKSTCFVICRDDIQLSAKEKYFQREILFHLLTIVQCSENLNPRTDSRRKEKSQWTTILQSSKDYFKTYLMRLLLFLTSPFQNLEDRIFSLHLFAEKTNSFEYFKQFSDKNNDKFPYILEAFVVDLIDCGVKDLNIYSLKTYSNDFIISFSNQSVNPPGQNLVSLEFVHKKIKEQLSSKHSKNESFYKTEISVWYEQIKEEKVKYECGILKYGKKIFANMSMLYSKVVDTASYFNDLVIIAQHEEKKLYIQHLKDDNHSEEHVKKRILSVINELLHEKTIWHLKEHYPQSWALSPFESNNRIRKKLERSFLEIDKRYILNDSCKQLRSKHLFASFLEMNSTPFTCMAKNELNMFPNEQTNVSNLYTASVKVILFDEEIDGEILITTGNIQFFSNQKDQDQTIAPSFSSKKLFFQSFAISFSDIHELVKCRYELQNIAMEIFLNSGLTYLIAFESSIMRDECFKHIFNNRELLPNLVEGLNLVTLTQMWRERRISNFVYLTHLNKLSGRTLNDLMQYPVFPFVIADYQSDILNLKCSDSFRNFSRPIAVQKKEREKHYIEQYNYINSEIKENYRRDKSNSNSFQFVVSVAPYHYGAHYSNSGIVLHYLVRLPPYTQMFLQYQDKNFDIPDRTFHSIQTTWRLATEDSTNGFKELIPEFFYLPEFLMNYEKFNFGLRQNGEQVNHVILPRWCRNNARLFTLINLQALESNYVTQNLNHWIDLIFGYQQSGKAAIEAINVFHPATYYTSDLSKIEDQVKRHAIQTMIKTFGQMPNQLFNMPHPTISPEALVPVEHVSDLMPDCPSMGEVIGLKWGNYVGSPIYPKPIICFKKEFSTVVKKLWALPTNDVLLLPPNSCLIVNYNQQRFILINALYIVSYSLCTWSEVESTICIKNKEDKVLFTHDCSFLDKVCLCESVPDYDWLLVGYESGLIIAFSLTHTKNTTTSESKICSSQSFLVGHLYPITSITINKNFSIALSTDSSGVCILWDMNKQQYIRTIIDNESNTYQAQLSTISDTLGDLAVVSYSYNNGQVVVSKLTVFTINGDFIGDVCTTRNDPYITALCYSTASEGQSINVIATGLSDGSIKMWSSWDLISVRHIKINQIALPIKSISFSFTNDLLYIIFENNSLLTLENSPSQFATSNNANSNISNRKNFRLLDLTYLSATDVQNNNS